MDTIAEETQRMTEQMIEKNGVPPVQVACLMSVTRAMFREYGADTSVSMEGLRVLQARAIFLLIESLGVDFEAVMRAHEELERSGQTRRYLSSLPH